MTTHETFAGDLALYAMGALEGEELTTLVRHLETCAECREELERLYADLGGLALTAPEHAPPARARERLLTAIANEPQTKPADELVAPARAKVIPLRRYPVSSVAWLAAAAAVVLAAVTWQRDVLVRDELARARQQTSEQAQTLASLRTQATEQEKQLASLRTRSAEQEAALQHARDTLAAITAPDAQHFALVAAPDKLQPQGKAIWLKQGGNLLFTATNLPALPAGKAYELWLIPEGGAPLPAGVFTPDKNGNAVVMNPPLPAGTEAKVFAVTVEPAAGSAAPTSKPMLMSVSG